MIKMGCPASQNYSIGRVNSGSVWNIIGVTRNTKLFVICLKKGHPNETQNIYSNDVRWWIVDEVKELLALVFSAGGVVGWVKAKIKDIEGEIKEIKRRLDNEKKNRV